MNPVLVLQLVTAGSVGFLGFFVLSKNRESRLNRYFWFLAMSIVGWNGSLFIAISEIGQSLFWGRLAFLFGGFMPVGLYLFTKTFPARERKLNILDRLVALAGSVIAIASGTGLIVKSAHSMRHLYLVGDFSKLIGFHFLYFFGVLIFSFIMLLLKHRRAVGVKKLQLKYVLLGFLSFFIPFVIVDIVAPLVFSVFKYNNLGPIFALPMVFFIAYAIVRHRLMDISIVIQRGAIYSALLALIVGFYLAAIFVLETIFRKATNLSVLASGGLTAVLGIFGVPPLEHYFRKVTDKIFFKDRYEYSEAMHALGEILNENLDLRNLLGSATAALERIFRAEQALMLLDSNPQSTPGKINDEEVAVPIVLGQKHIGTLVLGKKLSGDAYTSQDEKFLKTFARQAAVAIEKAELYKEVRDYSQGLEERVKQRTAQLQKLQEAQRQMFIDISHGLQTPLTVIKGEIGCLKRRASARKKREGLKILENSLDKVSQLTYDLLRLAKLESSQNNLPRKSVNLSGVLREILEYVGTIAQEKRITISNHIDANLKILGNKKELEELITNLISNAIKYTETAKNKKIDVELHGTESAIELTVEDTGWGIGAEDLPHIFERFYRVKNQSADIEGAGLGLAIAKKIAEKHGGTIEVRSKLGQGTRFTVKFPMKT